MMNIDSCCTMFSRVQNKKSMLNQCNNFLTRIYSIYALHPKHFVSYLSVPLNDHKVTVNHILPLAPLYNQQHKFIEVV